MNANLTQSEIREKVVGILKRTDWKAYWKRVDRGVASDVAAYDEARRRSLAKAHEKVLR